MNSFPVRVQFTKHTDAEQALLKSTEKGVEMIKPSAINTVVWLMVSGKDEIDAFDKAGRFTVLHRGKIAQMQMIANPVTIKRS